MDYITIVAAIFLILAGTISGYITNKYAVRWLFKPVTLFGRQIFDVSILSTDKKQEAFINSLSDCVENKILTTEVLKKEIINETIKSHLDEIIDDFLSQSIPESFKGLKLSELKGFDESTATLKDFADKVLDQNTDKLLIHVLEAVKVSDYLTEEQLQYSSDNFSDSLKYALKNNPAVKDKLNSIKTELVFAAMFDSDGRTALAKLASKLFSGRSFKPFGGPDYKGFPNKLNPSIKSTLSSTVSDAIEGKNINEYVSDEKRRVLADMLRDEILKNYDKKIGAVSDSGTNAIIRRLSGSDRIKATISDVIFDYLNKNLTDMLNGKVKETVKIALGRLNPNQLCDIAERLLHGELKYLSYFGGIVGLLISIPALFLTLGSFTSSGFASGTGIFFFNLILMGFIGVITNIIAIQMFFRPYKKIEFLAKHNNTKPFSQGLILQNQRVFAHTLGEYIGISLLTHENITKMLELHKDSFIKKLSANIVPAVTAYFKSEANTHDITSRIFALIFNQAAENKDSIGDFISREVGEKNFRSLIDLDNNQTNRKFLDMYLDFVNKNRECPEDDGSEEYDNKFIIYALTKLIKKNASLTHNIWLTLEAFYNTEIADKRISDFISVPELSTSASKTIAQICKNDAAFNDFRNAAENCIASIANGTYKFISDELKDSMGESISRSVYNSAIHKLPNIIDDISLDKVIENKVIALEAPEIQELILSFASPVFKKLYALGCIGCVFGINAYLSFILFITDKLFDKRNTN